MYGVLLLGTSQAKADNLLASNHLLSLFGNNLGCKIQQHFDYSKKVSEVANENSEQFIQRARHIVHETNNPLTVIRNYLQLLSKRLAEDDPAQTELKTIKQEIDRVGNIILRCNETLEVDTERLAELDLNKLISELISIFNGSLFATHNIKSTLKLDKKLNVIQSDRDIIKQIITNLVKNSVEAIKDNGEILITTGNININGVNFVELKIEDTGTGIPADIMRNLYKPVSSTKGNGHSGLGLSITKNLLDKIGGSISCRTDDMGTAFSIQLPEKN